MRFAHLNHAQAYCSNIFWWIYFTFFDEKKPTVVESIENTFFSLSTDIVSFIQFWSSYVKPYLSPLMGPYVFG